MVFSGALSFGPYAIRRICCFRMPWLDALWRRSRAAWSRASKKMCRCFYRRPAAAAGRGAYNCGLVITTRGAVCLGRVQKCFPAELPRIPNERAISHTGRWDARRHPNRGRPGQRGAVPARAGVRRRAVLGFTLHVEIARIWGANAASGGRRVAAPEVRSTCRPATRPSARPRCGRLLCASNSSGAAFAAYAYSAAGAWQSTTDLAWDCHAGIFETATALGQTERFSAPGREWRSADIDLGASAREAMRTNTFGEPMPGSRPSRPGSRIPARVEFDFAAPLPAVSALRPVERFSVCAFPTRRLAPTIALRGPLQHPGRMSAQRLKADRLRKAGDRPSSGRA